MFDKLTKEELLGLATQYNIINNLRPGYSKLKKSELIAELKNHLKYNEEKKQFESINNTVNLRKIGPMKPKPVKLSAKKKK